MLGQPYWGPILERAGIENAFIVNLPYHNLITGQFQKVPVLSGIASEEGLSKFQ